MGRPETQREAGESQGRECAGSAEPRDEGLVVTGRVRAEEHANEEDK